MIDVYEVKDAYIEYLRTDKGFNKVYDPKILVRTHTRKYIGVVLTINNFKYFAPFSSPKNSDFNIDGTVRKSTISILRMTKDNQKRIDGKELLGTITINNMIPVPDIEIVKYDVDNETDIDYKNLVLDEMRWVEKNDNEIIEKSRNLYFAKVNESTRRTPNNAKTLDATINFVDIEKACLDWINKSKQKKSPC